MKRFIVAVVLLAVVVIVVGFYRDWFALQSSDADNGSNKVNVNLTVDRDKIKQDAEAVQNKTVELTGKITDQAPVVAPPTAAER